MNIEEIEESLHQFPAEQGKVIAQLLRICVNNTAILESIMGMLIRLLNEDADKAEFDEIVKETITNINSRVAEIFADISPRLSR